MTYYIQIQQMASLIVTPGAVVDPCIDEAWTLVSYAKQLKDESCSPLSPSNLSHATRFLLFFNKEI
jgi:hypothetical protein